MMRNANGRNRPIIDRTGRNTTRTLPWPRSTSSTNLIYLSSLLFFLGSTIFSKLDEHWTTNIFILISVLVPFIFLIELTFRVLYLFEEYQHLFTRYENNYWTLLKDVFYFSSFLCILVISSSATFAMLILLNKNPVLLFYQMGPTSLGCSLASILFLARNLGLNCGPLYDSLWIENSNGLDYGSGMAHSFFHGYLKLVLPKTGTEDKNLEELMQDYEASHHVKIQCYKLFILIPKSLNCPTSLKNANISPSIEESSSLNEKIITVAGVQNRVYKNSVYKIKSDRDNKPFYVCAEYATPLKTFKDVVFFKGEHSNYYNKHKNDIVLQFYLTLYQVLQENENCKHFCELIFYDDKDENGRDKDVGKILLQRIRRLNRN